MGGSGLAGKVGGGSSTYGGGSCFVSSFGASFLPGSFILKFANGFADCSLGASYLGGSFGSSVGGGRSIGGGNSVFCY